MSRPKQLCTPLAKQTWVVMGIFLMMIGNGMNMGISNCMLPALQAPDSTIAVDLESWSWLNASMGISSTITYLASSILMASYGRRLATIIGLVPAVISPIMCYLAMDFPTLLIGRFLGGVGIGSVVGSVVTAEYTTPEYRGVFLNIKVWSIVLGFTLVHILGHYFHWRTVMLTILVPYVLNILMAFTWPESPSWLSTQKRFDECTESFHWLRGDSEKASRELNAMIEVQRVSDTDDSKSFSYKMIAIVLKFTKKNFLKPLGLCCITSLLLEASGRHIFPAYAMQFIQQMDNNKSNEFFYTMCIDLVINISTVFSVVLIKTVKRKTLLLTSGTLSVIVFLAVSLYYYLKSVLVISEDWNVASFVLFGLYFVFVNAGCTSVSFTLMGELFPLEHRSIGSAMSGVLIGTFAFVTLKITPIMLETIKVYGTFAVYGVTMGICLIALFITLPETKDKTLQEIEAYFNTDSKPITILINENVLETDDPEVKIKLLR